MSNNTHELVGWFFLTRNLDNSIKYQGRIVSIVDPMGFFMVDFFSWMHGGRTYSRMVSIDEIHHIFYFSGKSSEEHQDVLDTLKHLHPVDWLGNKTE